MTLLLAISGTVAVVAYPVCAYNAVRIIIRTNLVLALSVAIVFVIATFDMAARALSAWEALS